MMRDDVMICTEIYIKSYVWTKGGKVCVEVGLFFVVGYCWYIYVSEEDI